jgi:RNA polymerase sigma-70 factor (ECF subfamily)
MIYCIVPRELALKIHDELRDFFRDEPGVEVAVERRVGNRRKQPDKRSTEEAAPVAQDRRKIRNKGGRRVGERRATQVTTTPVALPRKAKPYADQLVFVERVAPSSQHEEDLDTARLVIRLQAGERQAFNDLYLRYFDRAYGYLRIALKDAHEAEDLAQQAFLKVFESVDRYERRTQPFRAWLFRIVCNAAVDHFRKHESLELEEPARVQRRREIATNGEDMAQALESLSDKELLFLIEQLPPLQRQVIVMHYMLDMAGVEIAEVLERDPAAVRQLKRRALTSLEGRLAALGRAPAGKQIAGQ